jgi:hypothetical protein
MKPLRSPRTAAAFLCAALTFVLLEFSTAAERQVLFIGNSFTQGSPVPGGVPELFDRLAQAGGQGDPVTVMSAVGGTDFRYHATNATTRSHLASRAWTDIILQNYSTEPTHLEDGTHSLSNHFTYGSQLYDLATSQAPLARVFLFETWSRAASHALIKGVSNSSGYASTAAFQSELRANYRLLAELLNREHPANPPVTVAPVGDAWESAGALREPSDPFFSSLHGSDNYHGNSSGYYFAAAVIYSHVFGVSPRGLAANPLISGLNLSFTVPPFVLEDIAWATASGGISEAGPLAFLGEPNSQAVHAYQPATFAARIRAQSAVSIQWLTNGVPVPGAKAPVLHLASAPPSWNGIAFSVTADDGAGRITSTNAILTVTGPAQDPAGRQTLLIDFGSATTGTTQGSLPDDPDNAWNNISEIGTTVGGRMAGLLTTEARPTGVALTMLSRFNGANANGTTASTVYPPDATRDSLYGNTEVFSGQSNIFPAFKLSGLDPQSCYHLSFYASRTGVSDNRETLYSVSGATTKSVALNAANNINTLGVLHDLAPDIAGELTVRLSPGPRNNNGNHFTYLGVLRIDLAAPRITSSILDQGTLRVEWTGGGSLESAEDPIGPWTRVDPAPHSPYRESITSPTPRYFRLRASF